MFLMNASRWCCTPQGPSSQACSASSPTHGNGPSLPPFPRLAASLSHHSDWHVPIFHGIYWAVQNTLADFSLFHSHFFPLPCGRGRRLVTRPQNLATTTITSQAACCRRPSPPLPPLPSSNPPAGEGPMSMPMPMPSHTHPMPYAVGYKGIVMITRLSRSEQRGAGQRGYVSSRVRAS